MKILVQNRSASFHYQLLDTFEAGLVLCGTEVKSLRSRQGSLAEAFIVPRDRELFLHHAHIASYDPACHLSHAVRRERKLLLHKRQINKVIGQIIQKGMTAIPLKIYLTTRGLIKLEIALAIGLKKEDKRQTIKEKEWKRQQHRILKKDSAS